jgi:DNA-binding transcriptional MerR regulator
LTIGAVCKVLEQEFPDISISKIRYLEGEKLLTPRRTPGGYRLYSTADVTRLRTILRLQRDEFLPLRVIRQELAARRNEEAKPPSTDAQDAADAPKPVRVSVQSKGGFHTAERVMEYTGASKELLKELEDFCIISGETRGGNQYYDDAEREIVKAVSELSKYGVTGRNLRIFRTSAEREVALLQQILAPRLRSRNPERRQEAVEALENLASVASHLKYLLLVRELRQLVK